MNKKLKKLEEVFNIAEETIDSYDLDENNDIIPYDDQYEIDEVVEVSLSEDGKVFELIELKRDFLSVKINLQKLIRKGQRLLDSALENPDVSLNARQIEAISRLSEVIGKQCQSLTQLYIDIESIEGGRNGKTSGTTINTQHNNAIFVGDTAKLLEVIKNS